MGDYLSWIGGNVANLADSVIDAGTIAKEILLDGKWPRVENLEVKLTKVDRKQGQFTFEISVKIYNPTSLALNTTQLDYSLAPQYYSSPIRKSNMKKSSTISRTAESAKGSLRFELCPNDISTSTTTITVPFPDQHISGYQFQLSWMPSVDKSNKAWVLLNFNFKLPDDLLQSQSLWKLIQCYVRTFACALSCVKCCHCTYTTGGTGKKERRIIEKRNQ